MWSGGHVHSHTSLLFRFPKRMAPLTVVRDLTPAPLLQTPTDARGPHFTTEDARRVIHGRTPRFRFSPSAIHTASVGKEDGGRYKMRTLSWFLVPLLAVTVLGMDGAQQYFPPILPSLPGAQFSTFEVVAALRVVLQQNPGLMTENDIQPDPRDGSSLYFRETLQTALLDGILALSPQLYAWIGQYQNARFQTEEREWQQRMQAIGGASPQAMPDPFALGALPVASTSPCTQSTVPSVPPSDPHAVHRSEPMTWPSPSPSMAPAYRQQYLLPQALPSLLNRNQSCPPLPVSYEARPEQAGCIPTPPLDPTLNPDPYARWGPPPNTVEVKTAMPTMIDKNFAENMKRRANQILRATNPAASASGFAADPLPRQPRKRPHRQPDTWEPPRPVQASRRRIREERELTGGNMPTIPVTESQLTRMVDTLSRMPGPSSYRDTSLLPPVDAELNPAQQFLRDYHALQLPVPPADDAPVDRQIPVITLNLATGRVEPNTPPAAAAPSTFQPSNRKYDTTAESESYFIS